MTRTIATCIAILLFYSASAQDNDTGQLYALALKTFVAHLTRELRSAKEQKAFATDTIFFENRAEVKLPLKIGHHVIQYCNDSNKMCAFEGNSVGMNIVWPIQVNKGEISIAFTGCVARRKDGIVSRSIAGGTRFTFVYDRTARRYKVKKILDWGI